MIREVALRLLMIPIVIPLAGAVTSHIFGVKLKGSGLKAADHIHYSPILIKIYNRAERDDLDTYAICLKIMNKISKGTWAMDRGLDWIYEKLITVKTTVFADRINKLRSNYYVTYLGWLLIGSLIVTIFLLRS